MTREYPNAFRNLIVEGFTIQVNPSLTDWQLSSKIRSLFYLHAKVVAQLNKVFDPFGRMTIVFFVVFRYLEKQVLSLVQAWMKIKPFHQWKESVQSLNAFKIVSFCTNAFQFLEDAFTGKTCDLA